jgi:hypothetical protein
MVPLSVELPKIEKTYIASGLSSRAVENVAFCPRWDGNKLAESVDATVKAGVSGLSL